MTNMHIIVAFTMVYAVFRILEMSLIYWAARTDDTTVKALIMRKSISLMIALYLAWYVSVVGWAWQMGACLDCLCYSILWALLDVSFRAIEHLFRELMHVNLKTDPVLYITMHITRIAGVGSTAIIIIKCLDTICNGGA